MRALSPTVHGILDYVVVIAFALVVSVVLVALPWILRFSQDTIARDFYVGAGALIFVVWLITDYKAAQQVTGRR